MRVLLDTNVLIDLYAQREPYSDDAQKLLIMRMFGDAELWASAKSFTDIFYVLSKDHETGKICDSFTESFKWIDLCSVDGDDIKLAASEKWKDFEDCVVNICADKVKADYLLTHDSKGFSAASIPILSPTEFFELMSKEYNLEYDAINL